MPLSAVAAALGHGITSNFGGTDAFSNWGNYAVQARQMQANQAFTRRFNRIDYTIKHQGLHREDIRDLCDLTVGRMDVYLIVGTLVLTFSIGWFTNNSILESGLPAWFITLFLLSNFTASAYMVFAVWLAMHASVAAHSISVRLLTSAARLSIPSAADIEAIETSIMPTLAEFMSVGQSIMQSAKSAFGSEKQTSKAKTSKTKDFSEKPALKVGSTIVAGADDEDDISEDVPVNGMVRDDHFKYFLREQRRWLSYDAYARICMCFGMNQMLQSLSYYILGMVWKVSSVSAVVCYFAVKILGCLLLHLDVGGFDGTGGRQDALALVFLYILPPMIASFELRVRYWPWLYHNPVMLTVLIAPVFILHAGWLVYLACELYRGSRCEGAEAHNLPTRLRTVAYLNVLQPEQKEMVTEWNLDQLQGHIMRMQAAREQLAQEMQESMVHEAQNKKLGRRSRGNKSLAHAHKNLVESIADGLKAKELAGWTDEADEREFARANRQLDRFAVWDQAPEICAVLKAFKDREVQGWLSDDEKRVVETATQDFLSKCHELGFGVEAVAQGDATLPQCEREKRSVRIESYNDLFSTPCSVLISMHSGEILEEPAQPHRSISEPSSGTFARLPQSRSRRSSLPFPSQSRPSQLRRSRSGSLPQVPELSNSIADFRAAFEVALPNWSRSAAHANRPSHAGVVEMQRLGNTGERSETEDEGFASTKSFIPSIASPDDRLPGALVQKLTLGTAAIWLLCAFFFPLKEVMTPREFPRNFSLVRRSALRPLATTWPIPAAFLEVGALQCDRYGSEDVNGRAHRVYVGGEFSTYVVQRALGGDLGQFSEIAEVSGGASTIFCDVAGCNALVRKSSGSPWVLQPIGSAAKHGSALVRVPSGWRGPVAAAWYSPKGDQNVQSRLRQSRATPVRVAAWDGTAIVIADMIQRHELQVAWSVKPRFRLFPEQAPILHKNVTEDGLWNETNYDDVRALQLSGDAQTLLVLQGNEILDAWDVARGDLVARWYIDGGASGSYTAMCYDGQDLLLAQQLNDGLVLQAIEAPAHLRSVFQTEFTHHPTQVADSEVANHADRPTNVADSEAFEASFDMQSWPRNVDVLVQLSGYEVISV